MGQEITDSRFTDEDFERFHDRLTCETRLLADWFRDASLCQQDGVGGFELEAWLIDGDGFPAPVAPALLDALADSRVVPELARFNIEINGDPAQLQGSVLTRLQRSLASIWQKCSASARKQQARMIMIGMLPTSRERDFTVAQMTPLNRYKALDEQLHVLRGGGPVIIDINGRDSLRFCHDDVMLESATTSMQIHLKVNPHQAVRYFNAAKIISAPMVAIAANSPFLFGASLWDETRIPLFEQSVRVGASDLTKRVSFGLRYLHESMMECFQANLDRYPILLPRCVDEPVEAMAHLGLHNGTIWRWNRPLVGFNMDGQPHLRIEHRVLPAGPTILDMVANMALFFGLMRALANQPVPLETRIDFNTARDNFYRAARGGLKARVDWFGGPRVDLRTLWLEHLLPLSEEGLVALEIDPVERKKWLGIARRRLLSAQTGAVWQRAWVERYGMDMQGLVETYLENQNTGLPVSDWSV